MATKITLQKDGTFTMCVFNKAYGVWSKSEFLMQDFGDTDEGKDMIEGKIANPFIMFISEEEQREYGYLTKG